MFSGRDANLKYLPKELLLTIEDGQLEWDGHVRVYSSELTKNNGMKLRIEIVCNDPDQEKQKWEMELGEVFDYNFDFGTYENLEVFEEHYLISNSTDEQVELYIKKSAQNSVRLYFELSECFINKFEYLSLENFLHSPLKRSCNQEHGLFARGASSILEEIKVILENNGCEPYFLQRGEAMVFRNGKWIALDKELITLIIGDSFFVTDSLKFNKV